MQGRTWKYLLAVGGLVGAVACTDDRQATTPTMPARVSAALTPGSCDFTQMKKDARAYFASTQNPVYDLMTTGASQYKTGGATAFRPTGFLILAQVELALKTAGAISGTVDAGNAFVGGVVICMGYPVDPDGYKGALGTTGLFAVRTLNSVEPAVSRGTLVYGAEPDPSPDAPATPKGWGASAGGLASLLLYGGPRDFPSFTSETGAAANGFELRTHPANVTFTPAILGGTCGPVTGGSLARLLHQHNNQTAILQKELLSFCTTIITRNDQGSGILAFARRMGEWLSPRPLHAATTMLLAGGMGGSLGGLSPIGPVVVDGSTVTLTITQQPTTATINTDFNPAIKVSAVTANGTPLGGVQITLTVLGNNGNPILLSGNIVTTGNDGVATFDHLQTNKAGGYLFQARGSIASSTTKADTTAMINVSGQ